MAKKPCKDCGDGVDHPSRSKMLPPDRTRVRLDGPSGGTEATPLSSTDRRIIVPGRDRDDESEQYARIRSLGERPEATPAIIKYSDGALLPADGSLDSISGQYGDNDFGARSPSGYGRYEKGRYGRPDPNDGCEDLRCTLDIYPDGHTRHPFTRLVNTYDDPEERMLRGAILRRGDAGEIPNGRGAPPVMSMVHLAPGRGLRINDPVPHDRIIPTMGYISEPTWEVRNGVLHCTGAGINRAVYTFGAVFTYSCDCKPEANIFWLVKKVATSGGRYRFDPPFDHLGSNSDALQRRWMAAITYTSDQRTDKFHYDRYGRVRPGDGPRAVCMKSAVDNTTVPHSYIVIGIVKWSNGKRCVQARTLKFLPRRGDDVPELNGPTATGSIAETDLRAAIGNDDIANLLNLP